MTNSFHMRLVGRGTLPALVALSAALLTLGVGASLQAPSFLEQRLGEHAPNAPLVRRPATGLQVSLEREGYTVRHGKERVSLSSAASGSWTRFERGVERATAFGRETILVEGKTTEEFLTVERRQGLRTWRWRLDTGTLTPRLNPDGSVAFHDGALADLAIEPVRIVTLSGADVSPDGLRWSLARRGALVVAHAAPG